MTKHAIYTAARQILAPLAARQILAPIGFTNIFYIILCVLVLCTQVNMMFVMLL